MNILVLAIILSPWPAPHLFSQSLSAFTVGIYATLYLDNYLILLRFFNDSLAILEATTDYYNRLDLMIKNFKSVLVPLRFVKHLDDLVDCLH